MTWRILSVLIVSLASLPAAAKDIWTGVARVVAVGDVHGDYGQLVRVLRSAELIDAHGRWSGGKTHLVQTGDILDRGPDSRKVMDLLMALEGQARKAGGRVHVLIGNHEAMNVYGDLRYTTPEEFAAFDGPPVPGKPPGFAGHRLAFGPEGKYGKWIRGLNTIIRINDTVYVHGGISPKYAAMSISEINQRVRDELADFKKLPGGIVVDPEGPLWYRGLALGDQDELEPHVEAVLKRYGASRMVIGHTVTADGTITPRFGGQVVRIDVGLSASLGGHLAYFAIENARAFAWNAGNRIEVALDRPVAAGTSAGAAQ